MDHKKPDTFDTLLLCVIAILSIIGVSTFIRILGYMAQWALSMM
jgi:hypothetical protein